jgi:glycosyltransferase involved in cell wall biosynthesis
VQTGYTLRTQGITEAQAARGHDVHVVTRLGFPVDIGVLNSPDLMLRNSVAYHRLQPGGGVPASPDRRLDKGIHALERLVANVRPDVLHAHSKHDNAQASLAVGRKFAVPVVYEVRDFFEETLRSTGGNPHSDRYTMFRDAETWCMEQADVVVTLAQTMRSEIMRRGVDPDHVFVVPNGVSETFLRSGADGTSTRRQLGIRDTALVIGVVSTLNDYEGIGTLLDAMRLLQHPDIHLLVVGGGPAAADLRRQSVDLSGQVSFTGVVPHTKIAAHYSAIDIFCVPRRRTPVTALVPPLKPLEALALAVPILVSDLPPLTELLDDSHAGWAVAANDPEAWASQLDRLRGNAEERQQKGRQGRTWVSRNRTWPVLAEAYETVYRELGLGVRTTV